MKEEDIKRFSEKLKNSKEAYVLTGAGMSTESGIPDFRSKGSGIWNEIDPMKYATRDVLLKEPEKFYQYTFKRFDFLTDKKPNEGHYVLSNLEKKGLIKGIITQNVDGLHQEAGSENVWEVHGNIKNCYCMKCSQKYEFEELVEQVKEKDVPRCHKCQGMLRPDVILFGDPMPQEFFQIAQRLRSKCDFVIVVGSSLQVYPVAGIAELGKPMGIVNLESTPYDSRAEVVINSKCSEALKKIEEYI